MGSCLSRFSSVLSHHPHSAHAPGLITSTWFQSAANQRLHITPAQTLSLCLLLPVYVSLYRPQICSYIGCVVCASLCFWFCFIAQFLFYFFPAIEFTFCLTLSFHRSLLKITCIYTTR